MNLRVIFLMEGYELGLSPILKFITGRGFARRSVFLITTEQIFTASSIKMDTFRWKKDWGQCKQVQICLRTNYLLYMLRREIQITLDYDNFSTIQKKKSNKFGRGEKIYQDKIRAVLAYP